MITAYLGGDDHLPMGEKEWDITTPIPGGLSFFEFTEDHKFTPPEQIHGQAVSATSQIGHQGVRGG